jgi:BCD family chlorophyll transporter-like MFS transporter
MFDLRRHVVRRLATLGPRWLPFADVATDDVPLSRLLRLSLLQITVGMALVLLAGTLNRVMIVELGVQATVVAVMLALPLLFAPFRALIGFRSDHLRTAIGWRRTPFLFRGTMLQFGGFAIMPFALLVLSGQGYAADAPRWLGVSSAALAFLLVGAGVHIVQTVALALASDLVREEDQPKVVGLMYVMLLLGMIAAAFIYGAMLTPYTPGALIAAIQGSAVVTVVLNGIAMWKQEPRDRARAAAPPVQVSFRDSWAQLAAGHGMTRLLVVIAYGTAGFGMADVLMEPYGGQVLGMAVGETTRLTVVLAAGTLAGFTLASHWLLRGGRPLNVAFLGAAAGVLAFLGVILSALGGSVPLFVAATLLAGFGAGLFGHGTLTATLRIAPRSQTGLALGAWGAVQTTAAGLAIAAAGVIRDGIAAAPGHVQPAAPYIPVFALEAGLLVLALAAGWMLWRGGLDGTRGGASFPAPTAPATHAMPQTDT